MNTIRTLGGILTAAALILCLTAPASAGYSDLAENHWAFPQMDRARSLGIINGVGGDRMNPQGELTWAQFLAMTSRAFAPDRYRAESETLPWDQAGYQAARNAGLLSDSDALSISVETLDTPITRQDTAMLLSRVAPENARSSYGYGWGYGSSSAQGEARDTLSDFDQMDASHQSAVERLFKLGIVKGKSDGSFGPGDTLQRADGTVLLMRTLECYDRSHYGEEVELTLRFVDPSGTEISTVPGVKSYIGGSLSWIQGDYIPENHTLYSYDSNSVSSACSVYTVVIRPMTQLEIEQRDAEKRYYSGEITLEEYTMQDFWLRMPDENYRKHVLLFGNAEQRRFNSKAEAEQHMAKVTVPVWTIRKNEKVASNFTLIVHEALADDVTAIFTEIFNDPEQFPIHDLGGYFWRGDNATGEHNCGTAIDINSDQNYQVRDGKAMAGTLWSPGENPYSIPADSSVVRIFRAHGWSWGGDEWAGTTDPSVGYHDYMHFSYMGG